MNREGLYRKSRLRGLKVCNSRFIISSLITSLFFIMKKNKNKKKMNIPKIDKSLIEYFVNDYKEKQIIKEWYKKNTITPDEFLRRRK